MTSADPDLTRIPWRTGRSLGRTLYARTGGDDWKADTYIGTLDTRELADAACAAHNADIEMVPSDLVQLLDMGLEVRLIPAERGLQIVLTDGEGNHAGEVWTPYAAGIPVALDAARKLARVNGYGT